MRLALTTVMHVLTKTTVLFVSRAFRVKDSADCAKIAANFVTQKSAYCAESPFIMKSLLIYVSHAGQTAESVQKLSVLAASKAII